MESDAPVTAPSARDSTVKRRPPRYSNSTVAPCGLNKAFITATTGTSAMESATMRQPGMPRTPRYDTAANARPMPAKAGLRTTMANPIALARNTSTTAG